MPKQTSDRPVFPVSVGEVVGWNGKRAQIFWIRPEYKPPLVHLRFLDGSQHGSDYLGVPITELTDPPALPEHVQAAADEAVASGLLTDARRAVFGEGS